MAEEFAETGGTACYITLSVRGYRGSVGTSFYPLCPYPKVQIYLESTVSLLETGLMGFPRNSVSQC